MLTDRLLAENEALRAQLVAQRAENEALRAQLVARTAETSAAEQLLREKAMAEDPLRNETDSLIISRTWRRRWRPLERTQLCRFWLVEQVSVSLKRVPQLSPTSQSTQRTAARPVESSLVRMSRKTL